MPLLDNWLRPAEGAREADTARRLIHTCTLLAWGAETGHDPYGDGVGGADTATPGVPCYCYQEPARGEVLAPGLAAVGHAWRVLLGPDVAVTEALRVADVREAPTRDEGGAIVAPGRPVVAGPLAIDEVLRHREHTILVCSQATTGEVAP